MLNKGDYIKIDKGNLNNAGDTKSWTNRIDGIKINGASDFTEFKGHACLGIEYGSSGPNRAWY